MGVALTISSLVKRFHAAEALRGVDLAIEPGSFLVLLGPSGCGKTTLLRCLAGLEEPDAGEIVIDGQPVYSRTRGINVPPGQRGLGLVFQSYALWPHMTVYQNIAFGLEAQKLPRAEVAQRAQEALRDVRMGDYADRYPREISGGQQQRVALARMLAARPRLFLMDEPLSNLDARLRMDMRFEIKRMHHLAGATTVYVTHDQSEALAMATHIAVLRDGVVQQIDVPQRIYRAPANLFVADFIGNPKMNLLEATVRQEAGHPVLDFGAFCLPYAHANSHHDVDRHDVVRRDVVVAIRPEDITLSLEPTPDGVRGTVYSLLNTGAETILNVSLGQIMLTVRDRRALELDIDQPLWLEFRTEAMNLYDRASGRLAQAG
jgi:multiple sugar transport system ATP-binding protein